MNDVERFIELQLFNVAERQRLLDCVDQACRAAQVGEACRQHILRRVDSVLDEIGSNAFHAHVPPDARDAIEKLQAAQARALFFWMKECIAAWSVLWDQGQQD